MSISGRPSFSASADEKSQYSTPSSPSSSVYQDHDEAASSNQPLLPRWRVDKTDVSTRTHAVRRFVHSRYCVRWLLAVILFVLLLAENAAVIWTSKSSWLPQVTRDRLLSPSSQVDVGLPLVKPTGVTLVSAFFLVSDGKKHSTTEYWEWIANFLGNVEQPVLFYTSPDLLEKMQELRGDRPVTWNVDYRTAAEMPPIVELGGSEWAEAMGWKDPEQWRHVPGIYAPWTAKPWMMREAKNRILYNSEYFFWVDAGGFRESNVTHHFRGLPKRLEQLYTELPDDTVILGDASWPWPYGQEGVSYAREATEKGWMDRIDCHIQGGWYGGKPSGIDWWYEETLRITKLQSMLQRFAGKEQDIWTHVARLNYQRVGIQNMFLNTGKAGVCGWDEWFAYEYWADGPEVEDGPQCEIPLWNGPAEYAKFLELHGEKAYSPQSSHALKQSSPYRRRLDLNIINIFTKSIRLDPKGSQGPAGGRGSKRA